MSLSKGSKQRLVADPSVGVGDLEKVLTTFLDDVVKQGKVDFLEFTSRPSGISWKSACSPTWLVRLSPLLKLYLGVATNGVLPTKKHKAALEAVASARGLKEKSKKCMADWVDLTDDAIRCALAHLRSLHSCNDTRARAFRRMDRQQQETVQSLLDLLSQGGDEEWQAEVGATGSSQSLVPIDLPARMPSTSSLGSDTSFGFGSDSKGEDVDPAEIFSRILNQKDSNESEKSFGSVAAPGSSVAPSPEKGFLPGLLKEVGLDSKLSEGDFKILAGCEGQQPPSKPQKRKEGADSKAKVLAKASGVAGKAPAKDKQQEAADDVNPMSKKRAVVPDDQLDRVKLRKRVVSRAYHRAEDKYLALGKGKEFAQKKARKASAEAGEKFDLEHPRESQTKKPVNATMPKTKAQALKAVLLCVRKKPYISNYVIKLFGL